MKQKSYLNMISGLLAKLIGLAFGFIIPSLFISRYGSEMNGLMQSISSIFIYLNILEAGIGTASIQALYKPLAMNDTGTIGQILATTTAYYKKIGMWMLLLTIALGVLYPVLVTSSIDPITVGILVLLTGSISVLNYFAQAKNRILVSAEGKQYVLSNIDTGITMMSNIVKIVLILLGSNIILIQVVFTLLNFVKVLFIHLYMKSKYKHLDGAHVIDYNLLSNRKYTTGRHIAYVINKNIDVLVLTIFCDLSIVSIYSIYKMIFSGVSIVPDTMKASFTNLLGQLFAKNKDKFYKVFNLYEIGYATSLFIMYTIALIIIVPFLGLYTKNFTDANYILLLLPVLFALSELIDYVRWHYEHVVQFDGKFKETQKAAYIEMWLNLALSLLLVSQFGIYGALLATVFAMQYRLIYTVNYVCKNILDIPPWKVVKRWGSNLLLMILCLVLFYQEGIVLNNYLDFIILGFITLFKVSIVFGIGVLIVEYKSLKHIIDKIVLKVKRT